MYESPIELIISEIQTKLVEEKERRILKGVQNIGINVDKDELIRALAYDRGQYEKGYADRDDEIVRCKDCVYCTVQNTQYIYAICQRHGIEFKPFEDDTRTHFCAWGERREP